ncbi:ACH2-like protein [Mya arenaria]|uniref:ACH2-like protein n=2 Tax=Mya arenaria TaxID=6604 RepID=A0ABY7DN91_MYAAR|nr:acetylcholine receptor subunit alpha-like 1 isoform X1 [Mya arenaria]WAQ98348.1 ACH2-like protein [Mya arenaria]
MATNAHIMSFILGLVCMVTITDGVGEPPTEQRLHHFLLQRNSYNKLVMPEGSTINGTADSKLTVKLGMRLSQLLDVSEKNQILTTNIWLHHEWVDIRLRWDPQLFGGIMSTFIPSSGLWRPDITLYNNADGDFIVTLLTKAKVFHTGLIVWEPPAIYKTYCPINVEYFPFDQQECFMKFSSWTFDGHQIDLQHVQAEEGVWVGDQLVIKNGVDLCDYYQNVEWDIINVTARRKEKFYPCCPEPYPDITFNITIRRRTLFYTINLIMPCVAISGLTVLVFYLPSDSGEKITLSISILLALTVFFLLLSDINPPTSIVIPLIGKYLMFTMIVVTLSIFLTVYTLSVHFRSPATHKMSPWVKWMFIDTLPKIIFMKRPPQQKMIRRYIRTENGTEIRETPIGTPTLRERHDTVDSNRSNPNDGNLRRRAVESPIGIYPPELKESLTAVNFIADHLHNQDVEISEERDWNYVAMVLDRIFLIFFTTASFLGTTSIFLLPPTLYDHAVALTKDNVNCSR